MTDPLFPGDPARAGYRRIAAGTQEAADVMSKSLEHYRRLFAQPGVGRALAAQFAAEDEAVVPRGRAEIIRIARESLET